MKPAFFECLILAECLHVALNGTLHQRIDFKLHLTKFLVGRITDHLLLLVMQADRAHLRLHSGRLSLFYSKIILVVGSVVVLHVYIARLSLAVFTLMLALGYQVLLSFRCFSLKGQSFSMVELGPGGLDPNCGIEITPGSIEQLKIQVDISSIVEHIGVLGLESVGLCEVLQRLLVLTKMIAGQASIVVVDGHFATALTNGLVEILHCVAVLLGLKQ